MKKLLIILSITFIASFLAGCPASTETGTNENTNAEAPAKDLKTTIKEVGKKFDEAGKKKDTKFFEANLTDNFAGVSGGGFFDKATAIKYMEGNPCEPGDTVDSEENVVEIADGVALSTGKSAYETTCDGKTTKSEGYYAVAYVKDGETWKAVYYQEKAIPAKEEAKADEGAKSEEKPAAEAEAKKDEAPAAKEEPKKEEAPMAPKFADDAELGKALTAKETELWAAWAKKDIKPFEEAFAADFNEMTQTGLKNRADVLKQIGENTCEVSSTSVSDGHAIKINDDLVLFIYKGTAKGKCGDNELGTSYDASIWKKDGDSWKVVFHMESEEMKS